MDRQPDFYKTLAAEHFNVPYDEVTPMQRQSAKEAYWSAQYNARKEVRIQHQTKAVTIWPWAKRFQDRSLDAVYSIGLMHGVCAGVVVTAAIAFIIILLLTC